MRSSLTKCVLITNICNACFRGVTWKNWVAQVWQAGLKGCFPLSPPFMSLSVLCPSRISYKTNKKKKTPMSTSLAHMTHNGNRCKTGNSPQLSVTQFLHSVAGPSHIIQHQQKTPPTTTSLKAPMSARKCNSEPPSRCLRQSRLCCVYILTMYIVRIQKNWAKTLCFWRKTADHGGQVSLKVLCSDWGLGGVSKAIITYVVQLYVNCSVYFAVHCTIM